MAGPTENRSRGIVVGVDGSPNSAVALLEAATGAQLLVLGCTSVEGHDSDVMHRVGHHVEPLRGHVSA
jgi:hypothetical protein